MWKNGMDGKLKMLILTIENEYFKVYGFRKIAKFGGEIFNYCCTMEILTFARTHIQKDNGCTMVFVFTFVENLGRMLLG